MKKTLQLISICLLTVIFVLMLCLAFVPITVFSADTSFENSDTYKLLSQFLTDNPNRVAGTVDEHNAKEWLKNKLIEFGFSPSSLSEEKITNLDSYNLIATIDNASTNKQIVVGAHYDTVAGSLGASDNASGVTAALLIAKQLLAQKSALSFDIKIVFFGSEELGLLGSASFVEKNDLSNTVLMVNIDSIAVGDNLYIQSESIVTDFQRAFVEAATGSTEKLHNKPLGIGIHSFDYWGYGYYEITQMSDHTSFRLTGVPTLFFFSGNYPSIFWDFVESTNERYCVINTSRDTLELLNERGNQAVAKIDTVVLSTTKALTTAENFETFLNARSQLVDLGWFSTLYIYVLWIFLLAIVALVAVVYYKKLQKQAILGSAEAKPTKSIFSSPNAENVFNLDKKEQADKKEQNNKKQSSDVDDVFKF